MDDIFKIYIDQLRDGRESQINEQLNSDFLGIDEPNLTFQNHVKIEGSAYLADDELLFHWNIWTEALIPCSICSQPVPVEIKILNFYTSIPLSDIKGAVFNFKELLRETILLEVPTFAECNQGHCPKRKEFAKYLKETSSKLAKEEDGHRPFANLE